LLNVNRGYEIDVADLLACLFEYNFDSFGKSSANVSRLRSRKVACPELKGHVNLGLGYTNI
jgi:hypothetical protein